MDNAPDHKEPVAPSQSGGFGRVLRWAAMVVAGLALVVLACGIGLNTGPGRQFLADQLANYTFDSGLRIKVQKIEGSIYGQSLLQGVEVYDPEGVFASVPQIVLDWRPLSGIGNKLDIRQLDIKEGQLLRLPELLETQSDGPILPGFDIRIDQLTAHNFRLAEGVAGPERFADLDGQVDIRSGRAMIELTMHVDNGGDNILVNLDAEPDANRLALAADIVSPANGLLTRLLGLDKAVAARIGGQGDWQNWSGQGNILFDGQRLADLGLAARSGQLALSGRFRVSQILRGIALDIIGANPSISWKGRFEDRALQGAAKIFGAAVRIDANGTIDLGDNGFEDYDVAARLTDNRVLPAGVVLQKASAQASLHGPFHDFSAAYDIRASNIQIAEQYRIVQPRLEGNATYSPRGVTVGFDWQSASYGTGNNILDRLFEGLRAEGVLRYDEGRLFSRDIQLAGDNLTARLNLNQLLGNGEYILGGRLNASGIAVDNLARMDVVSDVQLRVGQDWSLVADVDAVSRDIVNQTAAQLIGDTAQLSATVRAGQGKPIVIDDANLSASHLALLGGGRYEQDGNIVVNATGQHNQYGPFDIALNGTGSGTEAQLLLESPLPALGLRNVRLGLAPVEGGFGIMANGQSHLGPFDGEAGIFAEADGRTRIAISDMQISATQLMGTLYTGTAGIDGRLDVLGGGLNGNVVIRPAGAGTLADIDITARRAQFAGIQPIRIARGELKANIRFGEGPLRIEGNASAMGISRGDLFVGSLAASGDVTGGRGVLKASVAGRRGSNFDLQSRIAIAPDRYEVSVDGQYDRQKIATTRPVIVSATQDGWRIARSHFSIGTGGAVIHGRVGDETDVAVSVSNVSLSLLDAAYSNLGFDGLASGQLSYRQSGNASPNGTAQLRLQRLTRSGLVLTSRPVDAAVNARLDAGRLAARTVVRDGKTVLGRGQVRITNLGAGDLADRLAGGRLLGELQYNGPADALWRLTGVETFDLTGNVAARINATGSINNPRIAGAIRTDDAGLESTLSGTVVTNIVARGRFDGSRLILSRFSGKAPNGGDVSGSGTIVFGDSDGVGIDLAIQAENAELLDRDDFGATVTGPITVKSNGNGGVLGGDLVVNRGRFQLGQAVSAAQLPNVRFVEINRRPDEAPPAVRQAPWRYNIKARADNRIAVTGLGLNSEWRTDIVLKGPVNEPRITGTAELVRGEYEFAGRDFDLAQGTITFRNQFPVDPRLDIRANANLPGLNAAINVDGTGQRPEISFSSIPALPEDELLARLIFGSSVTDISAPEAVQLAAALASLRSGGGLDPINALRGAVGLDRLRIVGADAATGQGTSVAAGKYITRNVYVEVISDGQGYSATQAEFQITRWLSILSTISTIGRQSINARISRDY